MRLITIDQTLNIEQVVGKCSMRSGYDVRGEHYVVQEWKAILSAGTSMIKKRSRF